MSGGSPGSSWPGDAAGEVSGEVGAVRRRLAGGARSVEVPAAGPELEPRLLADLTRRRLELSLEGDPAELTRRLRRALADRIGRGPGSSSLVAELVFLVQLFSSVVQDPCPRGVLELLPEGARGGEPASSEVCMETFVSPQVSPRRPDLRFWPGPGPGQGPSGPGLLLRVSTCRRAAFLDRPEILEQVNPLAGVPEEPVDVLLVSMPFADLQNPSIGLSMLCQTLPESASSRVFYATVPLAGEIGPALYDWISSGQPSPAALLGEWIFAPALRGLAAGDPEPFVEEVLRSPDLPEPVPEVSVPWLVALRQGAEGFVERCADAVLAQEPRLVGFTSVFQQHAASLALARSLRRRRPDLPVVFGGANCEGEMGVELLRRYDFVDAVVSGEAEEVFAPLVERLLAGEKVGDLPGVTTRDQARSLPAGSAVPNAPRVQRMDDLPRPDYGDLFRQWRASHLGEDYAPRLLLETSRGCWWGEKQHCTFCGLNGSSMAFRSKSPERVLDELEALVEHHPGAPVAVVDNILDVRYLRTLVPELARRRLGVQLFYEVKANLRKEHLRLLRNAGIVEIQPGIESFSTPVLELMRKGVSGLQNLQLLKWCRELGVRAFWNFLWGFAGEPVEEYERLARLVPWITHLTPPEAVGPLRLDRFSPNYFEGEALGYRDVAPSPAYRHVYGGSQESLERLAYYFRYGYRDGRDPATYTAPLRRALEEWQEVHEDSDLSFFNRPEAEGGARLILVDRRPAASRPVTVLTGIERRLYQACDRVQSFTSLARLLGIPAAEAEDRSGPLLEAGLLAREGDKVLALAVAAEEAAEETPAREGPAELEAAEGG